jgi:hypothetical protein
LEYRYGKDKDLVKNVENSGGVVARTVPEQPLKFPRHRYRHSNLKTKNACVIQHKRFFLFLL